MADTVPASSAPTGPDGQALLAAGKSVALRMWDEGPTKGKSDHSNDYETVGYALDGEATVTVDGKETRLTAGVSWLVPAGATHHYAVQDHFKAVEATSPPARG